MAAAKRFQEPDPHGLVHRRYWKSMVDLYFLVSSTECGSHTVADKMCVEEAHYHMNSFQYLDLKDPYYRNHNGDYFASDSLHFHGSLELWGNANGCINWCRSSSSWTVSHVGGMRLRKGPPMPRAKVLKRIARIAEYGVGR